ncbi:MFS domain-containing protein [Pycnococcus provasolii]
MAEQEEVLDDAYATDVDVHAPAQPARAPGGDGPEAQAGTTTGGEGGLATAEDASTNQGTSSRTDLAPENEHGNNVDEAAGESREETDLQAMTTTSSGTDDPLEEGNAEQRSRVRQRLSQRAIANVGSGPTAAAPTVAMSIPPRQQNSTTENWQSPSSPSPTSPQTQPSLTASSPADSVSFLEAIEAEQALSSSPARTALPQLERSESLEVPNPVASTPEPRPPPPPPPTPSTTMRATAAAAATPVPALPPPPEAPPSSLPRLSRPTPVPRANVSGSSQHSQQPPGSGPPSHSSSIMGPEESFAMLMGQAAPLMSWEASASSVGSFGLRQEPLQPPASPTLIVHATQSLFSAVTPSANTAAGAANNHSEAAPPSFASSAAATTTSSDAFGRGDAQTPQTQRRSGISTVAAPASHSQDLTEISLNETPRYAPDARNDAQGPPLRRIRSRDRSASGDLAELGTHHESLAPQPGTPEARRVMWIFTGLVAIMVVANLDNGALPASLKQLEMDSMFSLNLAMKGFLGSCTFIGLTVGAGLSGRLLQVMSSKRLLVITLCANVVFCLAFSLSTNRWQLFFTRAAVGATKSTAAVFCPVWVDNFGPHNRRTLWMSLIQGASPIGIMLGYVFAGIFNALGVDSIGFCIEQCHQGMYKGWRLPFLVQAILMGALIIMLVSFPVQHLDFYKPKALLPEMKRSGSNTSTASDAEPPGGSSENLRGLERASSNVTPRGSPGAVVESVEARNGNVRSLSSVASQMRRHEDVEFQTPTSLVGQLRLLLTDEMYVSLVATLSSLYFVVTGIQFWITDYLTAPRPDGMGIALAKVVAAFSATSATAPILGVVFGGFFIDRLGGYRGHYQRLRAMRACACFGALAVICALGTMGADNLGGVISGVWLLLFFGAMIVPVLTGVLLTVVPAPLQSIASSTSIISFQLFGYILAPLLCGVIAEVTSLTWGFRLVLLWSILAFLCLLPCVDIMRIPADLTLWLASIRANGLSGLSLDRLGDGPTYSNEEYLASLQYTNELYAGDSAPGGPRRVSTL